MAGLLVPVASVLAAEEYLPPYFAVGKPDELCVALCEADCTASTECNGFNFNIGRAANGSWGSQCDFTACRHVIKQGRTWFERLPNNTYVEHDGTGNPCRGAPIPSRWCAPPPLNNCTDADYARPRMSSLWLPSGTIRPNDTADTIATLKALRPAYTAFSPTWAFWNSQWNSKCPDPIGLCGRAWSPAAAATTAAATALGLQIVPLLEVCCTCVLNRTYDYHTGMRLLAADAVANAFGGYALDMVCGGVDEPQRATFLSEFAALLHPHGMTVSWFSHAQYSPQGSFPNGADYLYSMDTYVYTAPTVARDWVNEFRCQAGIGLEYPGSGTVAELGVFFDSLVNNTHLRAVGTWGAISTDMSSGMATLWRNSLTRFVATS